MYPVRRFGDAFKLEPRRNWLKNRLKIRAYRCKFVNFRDLNEIYPRLGIYPQKMCVSLWIRLWKLSEALLNWGTLLNCRFFLQFHVFTRISLNIIKVQLLVYILMPQVFRNGFYFFDVGPIC